jgi:hypothetical protein
MVELVGLLVFSDIAIKKRTVVEFTRLSKGISHLSTMASKLLSPNTAHINATAPLSAATADNTDFGWSTSDATVASAH